MFQRGHYHLMLVSYKPILCN